MFNDKITFQPVTYFSNVTELSKNHRHRRMILHNAGCYFLIIGSILIRGRILWCSLPHQTRVHKPSDRHSITCHAVTWMQRFIAVTTNTRQVPMTHYEDKLGLLQIHARNYLILIFFSVTRRVNYLYVRFIWNRYITSKKVMCIIKLTLFLLLICKMFTNTPSKS